MSHSGDPILTPGEDHEFPRSYVSLGRDALLAMRPDAGATSLTSLGQLARRQGEEPVLPLAALVFHCSRCGSTLFSRLFQHAAGTRVFAEPEALPRFLHAHSAALVRGEGATELRTFIQAFGLSPRPAEKRLVLKLTSLSTAYLPVFRAAFPGVPFIYLLREPVGVVQSLRRHPPGFLHDAGRDSLARLFGPSPPSVQGLPPPEWFAWYVAQNQNLAFRHRDEFFRVIDHRCRQAAYLEAVTATTTEKLSDDDPDIQRTLGEHSKGARRPFVPPAGAELDPLRAAVEPIAGPAYARWRANLDVR